MTILPQPDLNAATLSAHRGLITGNPLDQDAMLAHAPALAGFLDAGGRWIFNGHLLRPLVDGLAPFRPMRAPRRADFALRAETAHPVFAGIDLAELETNRGVAGFYGRGCNPPPPGAVVLSSLGPARVPVDWVWHRPRGGAVLSHAGNDLGAIAAMHGLGDRVWTRLIDWAAGGACVGPGAPRETTPPPPAAWPAPPPRPAATTPRLVAVSAGTYWHI